MFRILTLYLAKDSINKKRYDSVRLQKGVEQKIIVVSAKKIEIPNNLVVEVPEKYPLPIRVGLSINYALQAYWSPKKYDYLFKIDNDVLIKPNYIFHLISKNRPIIGPGCAMLIDGRFFEKKYGNRWPICYCDDMYMKAYAFALDFIEDIWEKDLMPIVYEYNPENYREYIYGKEYYKFGAPFWYICIHLIASVKNFLLRRPDRIPFVGSIYCFAGYLSEFGKAKYKWHRNFSEKLTKKYIKKFSKLPLMERV
jgi:hypothetical protein